MDGEKDGWGKGLAMNTSRDDLVGRFSQSVFVVITL